MDGKFCCTKFPPHRRYSLDAEGAVSPLPRPLIVGQVFLLLFYIPLFNAVIPFISVQISGRILRVRPSDQYLSRTFLFAYCGDQRSALCCGQRANAQTADKLCLEHSRRRTHKALSALALLPFVAAQSNR